MRQGLCNGMVSVRLSASLSVPAIDRCSSVRRVCCRGPGGQEISIDCCTAATAPQQHGGQQQMRAVSRLQPPYKAEHRLVRNATVQWFGSSKMRKYVFSRSQVFKKAIDDGQWQNRAQLKDAKTQKVNSVQGWI